MDDALITPDGLFELRCLRAPEVRLDSDGVWQVEHYAWFAAWAERDRWVSLGYMPTPNPRGGLALYAREFPILHTKIGFLGVKWSEAAAAPVAVANLQRLCMHVMNRDLARLLQSVAMPDAEAVRDAIEADIEAGVKTPFTLLDVDS